MTTSEGKAQVVPNVLSWLAEASRISGLLGILTPELRAHSHTLGPWQRTPNFQDRSPHCVIINAHHVTSLVSLITYSTLLLIGHATSMRDSKIRVDGPASTRCRPGSYPHARERGSDSEDLSESSHLLVEKSKSTPSIRSITIV